MSRRVAANLGVFVLLFGLMVSWALRNVVSADAVDRPYRISAEFAAAFGVLPNSEVTYRGVAFGAVTGVERIPGGVVIGMKIERGKTLPAGASAAVLRKSVIGEPYVDIEPPAGQAPEGTLRDGDRIPRERTSVPLEFSELLRSASNLVASVPPEDVTTLLEEAALALQGRTDALRALVRAGDRLSGSLAARTEALDRLSTNNTRITRVLAEHRDGLGRSLADLRAVSATLAQASGDTSVLLDRGSRLLGETASLVAAKQAELDCDLKVLEQVIDLSTTAPRLRGLAALIDVGPRAFAGLWDSTDREPDGLWVRVGLVSSDQDRADQFSPPKNPPAVPAIPACTSALRPSGVDYRPSSAAAGSQLPATGGGGAAAGALLAGAALVVRRLRLRSAR